MADLATIVNAARAVHVVESHAADYVRQLRLDQANVAVGATRSARWWLPWTVTLAASAAAVAFAVLWSRSADAPTPQLAVLPTPAPVVVSSMPSNTPSNGDPVALRVAAAAALVAQPGAQLAVETSSSTTSVLTFSQGVASFRVGRGHQMRVVLHDGELLLKSGGASIATGTTPTGAGTGADRESSIRIDDGDAVFTNRDGHVRPLPKGQAAVFAGASERAVAQLRTYGLELPLPSTPPATTLPPSLPPTKNQDSASVKPATLSAVEQWRRVRLLRGQGDFAGAVELAHKLGAMGDATWSPIALLEAARVEIGPLLSSERALGTCAELLRTYPTHALAHEAAAIRCRALTELGRSSECAERTQPKPD